MKIDYVVQKQFFLQKKNVFQNKVTERIFVRLSLKHEFLLRPTCTKIKLN